MKKNILLLCLLAVVSLNLRADDEILRLISQMTLEEKVRMCFGGEDFGKVVFPGVPRLHIPDIYGSDGPRGVTIGDVTAFPSGIGLAATWNPELTEQAGKVIGEEGRVRGVGIIFGPAFNINRDPLGARFFEYMSEDPVLSGKLAAAEVRGMQSMGVSACIKHLATNGRDWNRDNYMTWCDERTLREIYLRGFEIAVKEANPWACMTAANGLNGELCSDNQWLLKEVLKNEWGFKGIVLTDFCHSRSTVKAALAGLDVDMPWGTYNDVPFGKKLADAVTEGKVPMSNLDQKVYRLLYLRYQLGLLGDKPCLIGKGTINTPEHQAVAQHAAEEGITLLKNNRGLLPLNDKKIKNIVVLGSNCNRRFDVLGLGGSSGAESPFEYTALQGIQERLKGKANVTYLPLTGEAEFQLIGGDTWIKKDGKSMDVEYTDLKGQHSHHVDAPDVNFSFFKKSPVDDIQLGNLKATINGRIKAPVSGLYTFKLKADNPADLWVEDMGAPTVRLVDHGVPQEGLALMQLEAGHEYNVRIIYQQNAEGVKGSTEMNYWAKDNPSLRLEWGLPGDARSAAGAVAKYRNQLKKADAVVFVGGLDHNMDCEGRDRQSMDFPAGQAAMISELSKVNKNLIVGLIHGAPLTLPWLDKVPAVVDMYYPGMFGGKAFAEVLFGYVNPSGKLTFSWPKKYADAPLNVYSHQDRDNVYIQEKEMIGYRYYDTKQVEPLFPFGFGMSYTQFKYCDLQIDPSGKHVTFTVTNTGKRDGKETVQLYVGQVDPPVERPIHELKAFKKVNLKAGESQKVQIDLDDNAYSYWHQLDNAWKVDKGSYVIEIGSSSRDIRLKQEVSL